MSNNITGLPAEVVEEIKLKAEDCANRHINGRANRKLWETVFNANKAGATEYATKLHEVQVENDELRKWKIEAVEFQIPVISFAHKYLEVNLGDNIAKLVVAHLNEARDLLIEVFQKHESGLLPDRFVYDKIKMFLYGE